ncbi:MAG: NusG domain II-containing protein [Lachnospiraceae bacterium]|nr:NusG domain II-containing protein [Lachnospiraceae bacterium]
MWSIRKVAEMKREFLKKHVADICLIGIFLIIGFGLLFYILSQKHHGNQVLVQVNGECIQTFWQEEEVTYTIKSQHGENILRIYNGKVWLLDADCPDKICVNTGKIQYPGQSIICLPHKVVVEIKDNKEEN